MCLTAGSVMESLFEILFSGQEEGYGNFGPNFSNLHNRPIRLDCTLHMGCHLYKLKKKSKSVHAT